MYNVKCQYIYQNLHIIFILLHSQKSKTCVHKSIFTVLQNTIIIIQNTSTTSFSIFMYLSKLTHNFCTPACHRNPKLVSINPYLLYYKCNHYNPKYIYNTFLNFLYLSKLTHNFCTSAFTEIQNLCP